MGELHAGQCSDAQGKGVDAAANSGPEQGSFTPERAESLPQRLLRGVYPLPVGGHLPLPGSMQRAVVRDWNAFGSGLATPILTWV